MEITAYYNPSGERLFRIKYAYGYPFIWGYRIEDLMRMIRELEIAIS